MEDPTARESELRDYLRLLRRRKAIVVLTVVVLMGVVLAYSLLQTPKYTATAKVLLQSSGAPPQLNSSVTTVLQPSDIQTQIDVMTSPPVQAAVRQQVGSAPSVSATAEGQKDIIDVAATSPDRQQAASIANAYANAYVDFRRTQAVNSLLSAAQQIQAKVSSLDQQIAALNAQVAHAPSSQQGAINQTVIPQRNALSDQESAFKTQLAQLQVNSAVETGAAQVIAPAAVPSSPSSPLIVRNVLLAGLLGIILGIALAFLRDYLDDSVRTKEDLEGASDGLPVLGLIPALGSWRDESTTRVVAMTDPTSPGAEAYRNLRTSIQFLGMDRPLRTLQFTSPTAAEGKSTTVANLAVTLAWAGQRVIVVGCDLRRPRIHEFFGLSNQIGLTSALLGQVGLWDACHRVPGQERLIVLPSGPLPINPSELFGAKRTTEMLHQLQLEADVVLLDCPPVLPVTDAAVLSSQADATFLVASARETNGKAIARSIEVLRQVGAPLTGTILNRLSAQDTYGYALTYKYYRAERLPLGANGSTAGPPSKSASTQEPIERS